MDDDVGKVANSTPVGVCEFSNKVLGKGNDFECLIFFWDCFTYLRRLKFISDICRSAKALELFLKDLVEHCATEASKVRTRKISPSHLRAAVMHTDQFDFLKDIVENIPEDNTIHNSDEEEEEDKKKRKTKRKKEDGENGVRKRAPKGEGRKGKKAKGEEVRQPAQAIEQEDEEEEDEEMYSE
jgi:hypothetical protein